MEQSSPRSTIFFQGEGQPEVAGNSQLSSNPRNPSSALPGNARANNSVLHSMASSGPSVGASSLVTDANSGLSGGPNLQRSASINTESYMRLPASPMSFSSNNISISGSSVMDGSSVVQQSPNQDPCSQQSHQSRQHQGASSATSLPRMGQMQLHGGAMLNSFVEDPTISQLQKKPRLDTRQEGFAQQQVLQQLLQRQDPIHLQNSNPQLQVLVYQQRLRQQEQQRLQAMPPIQRVQFLQQQQHQYHQQQQQHQYQQQQQQQQFLLRQQHQIQGIPSTSAVKRPYDGGVCSRRLMQYLFHQRQRPTDNTIAYWRRFVAEYYSPRAKQRWCLSLYDNVGHHSLGVFPQAAMDAWQCDICGSKSGRGFEAAFEVLPRLNEIKFGSGVLDELLFLDLPREYRFPSGMMMLEYAKAIQETVYEQLRVVREGQLRVFFTPDLKILSWEFCARRHEELLPRRLVAPQVNQLLQVAQKCQSTISESGADGISQSDLQANSAMVVTAGRQLAKSLELQSLNDLGFSKRYVRCLQIADVVNSMKDLMDFCREQKKGPIEGLKNFPRCASALALKDQKLKVEETDQFGGLQGLPTDRNTISKFMTLQHHGHNSQHMGIREGALPSADYQNLIARQNAMNSSNIPGSSGIIPGRFQNSSISGFTRSQLPQQQQFQLRSLYGNGLRQQNQPQPSQAFQEQMIQQYLHDMSKRNNEGAVPQQNLPVQQHSVGDISVLPQGYSRQPPLSKSDSFKAASSSNSESPAPFGQTGSSRRASDSPQCHQNSDQMVSEISHEFPENGFFDNDFDDEMNFSWKCD